jgi:hypothetical protein
LVLRGRSGFRQLKRWPSQVPELGVVCGMLKVDRLADRVGGVQPSRLGGETHWLAVEAGHCFIALREPGATELALLHLDVHTR